MPDGLGHYTEAIVLEPGHSCDEIVCLSDQGVR